MKVRIMRQLHWIMYQSIEWATRENVYEMKPQMHKHSSHTFNCFTVDVLLPSPKKLFFTFYILRVWCHKITRAFYHPFTRRHLFWSMLLNAPEKKGKKQHSKIIPSCFSFRFATWWKNVCSKRKGPLTHSLQQFIDSLFVPSQASTVEIWSVWKKTPWN